MKIIVIGDCSVGKTNLILRYAQNQFMSQQHATIGLSHITKNIDDLSVKVQLWDTAGEEKFRSITRSYYNNAEVGLIVFDLNNEESLKSSELWLTEFTSQAPEALAIIVGNKADLTKACDGKSMAEKYGLNYFEVSALTGNGVEQMFNQTIEEAAKKDKREGAEQVINTQKSDIKSGCC
uniref:Rab-like protein n=1 Tax=Trepomonas sp. PC1 TaxID=1076344 RepID=A0A146KEC4_9EUKA|eukprot:JAP94837.1 Rab-like protein [Trepomonas sp. PC1]